MGHFADQFDEHLAVAAATRDTLGEPFANLVSAAATAVRAGGKLLIFGNGGSAADAQHIATELTVRFTGDRKAIAAIALTTDTSALTAIGNDLGFDRLFVRQLEALGRAGDLALGITTSGESPNVLRALEHAKDAGMTAAALAGRGGGKLAGLADPLLVVPSDSTARIQEMHIAIGHALCGALETELGLVESDPA